MCKSESAEIVSEKLVDKSIDPYEIRLSVTNSDINFNLIDNKVDEVLNLAVYYMGPSYDMRHFARFG